MHGNPACHRYAERLWEIGVLTCVFFSSYDLHCSELRSLLILNMLALFAYLCHAALAMPFYIMFVFVVIIQLLYLFSTLLYCYI